MSDPGLHRIAIPGPLRAHRLTIGAGICVLIGIVGFLLALFVREPVRAWDSVLIGAMIPLWISAGAMAFLAMNAIGGARWTVPLQRLMEGLGAGFPIALVGLAGLLICGSSLYNWADASTRQDLFHIHDGEKSHWMTQGRVLATTMVSLMLWILMAWRLLAISTRSGDEERRRADYKRWSVIYLLVFGVTFSLVTWDLLLGLQSRFISTTWGFYCFVSVVQTFLAVVTVVAVWLAQGPMKEILRPHLLKDLGTWTVAWSCMWAYLAYTQYIIIYFANTNDESWFYLMRLQHGYQYGIVLETLLRFPLPFLILLSQRQRTNPRALAWASGLVLAGSWIDLWWIVLPAVRPNSFHGPWVWPEVSVGLGFLGAYGLLVLRFWNRYGLVAHADPRLLSSISAEHLH